MYSRSLILFLFLSSLATSFAGDDEFFRQWEKLLHKDIQKNSRYWLAPKEASAEEEFKQTIKAFNLKNDWGTNNHPQCLYPARRLLIEKHFKETLFPHSPCPDYDEWINRLNPQGVSVVFAGNYPDNPGSLFGHTFLKFWGTEFKDNSILDYALNYSAEVSDDIGVLYAIKGLVGGYYGGFMLAPYYTKVNEYAEGEGRDLWEYRTALSPEESQLILAHVWELKNRAEFRYYFLSDNCSFFILRLLDIARPDWSLEEKLPWYVIPLETVKVMHENRDIIQSTHYRPSVRLRAQKAYAELGPIRQKHVRTLLTEKIDVYKENDSQILRASAMQLAAIHSRKDGHLPEDLAQKEEDILVRLSELPSQTLHQDEKLPSPHRGHDVAQVSLGFISDQQTDLLLGVRPGVHDLNDHAMGYLPYSELSIMHTQFRANSNKLEFQNVDFLSMTLLRPWNLNEREWSWNANFSYEEHSFIFSDDHKRMALEGQAGFAALTHKSLLLSFLLGAFYRGGELNLNQSAGPMVHMHLLMSGESFKSVNGIKTYQDLNHTEASNFQLVPYSNLSLHSTPNWDYQLEVTWPLKIGSLHETPGRLSLKLEHHF